jgi:hypothetical protein
MPVAPCQRETEEREEGGEHARQRERQKRERARFSGEIYTVELE